LEAQYITASNTILKRNSGNVFSASAILMPSMTLMLDYSKSEYKFNPKYKEAYMNEMESNNAIALVLGIADVFLEDPNRDIILLCGYHEWGFRHLHYFTEYLEKLTGIKPIKYKKGTKIPTKVKDLDKIKTKVEKLKEEYQDRELRSILEDKKKREKLLKSFKKDELKNILKLYDISAKDMTKSEMIELFDVFCAKVV